MAKYVSFNEGLPEPDRTETLADGTVVNHYDRPLHLENVNFGITVTNDDDERSHDREERTPWQDFEADQTDDLDVGDGDVSTHSELVEEGGGGSSFTASSGGHTVESHFYGGVTVDSPPGDYLPEQPPARPEDHVPERFEHQRARTTPLRATPPPRPLTPQQSAAAERVVDGVVRLLKGYRNAGDNPELSGAVKDARRGLIEAVSREVQRLGEDPPGHTRVAARIERLGQTWSDSHLFAEHLGLRGPWDLYRPGLQNEGGAALLLLAQRRLQLRSAHPAFPRESGKNDTFVGSPERTRVLKAIEGALDVAARRLGLPGRESFAEALTMPSTGVRDVADRERSTPTAPVARTSSTREGADSRSHGQTDHVAPPATEPQTTDRPVVTRPQRRTSTLSLASPPSEAASTGPAPSTLAASGEVGRGDSATTIDEVAAALDDVAASNTPDKSQQSAADIPTSDPFGL